MTEGRQTSAGLEFKSLVYRHEGSNWVLKLSEHHTNPPGPGDTNSHIYDFGVDGHNELVVWFDSTTGSGVSAFDVVDTSATVTLDVRFGVGRARQNPSGPGIETWNQLSGGNFEYRLYQLVDGTWRISNDSQVAANSVPNGNEMW